MFRPLPRLLRIWEVLSVIQDLPYDEQLEIIDRLDIASEFIHKQRFHGLFLLPDTDLISRSSSYINRSSNKITRQSLLYILSVPECKLTSKEEWELKDYFSTFSLAEQVQLDKMIIRTSPAWRISVMLDGMIADTTVRVGITPEVCDLYESVHGFSRVLFRKLLFADREETVRKILDMAEPSDLIDHINTMFGLANPKYLSYAIDRYIQTGGDREHLLQHIIPDWSGEDKMLTRARMFFSISPTSSLETFIGGLGEVEIEFFSAFVAVTVNSFDWHKKDIEFNDDELQAIDEIINNQV